MSKPETTDSQAEREQAIRAALVSPAAMLRFQAMEAREQARRLLIVAAEKEAAARALEAASHG
jgi:hypothetical protein